MPLPLAGTITLAAAGVGAAALVVALAIPAAVPAGGSWLDYPQAGSTIAEGLTQFTAHASGRTSARVDQFRFVLEDASEAVLHVENDLHPVVSGHDPAGAAKTLFVGRALWQAVPGSYRLAESYLEGGTWTDEPAITFSVIAPAPVESASPTPTPTTDTPTPTPTPTTAPTAAPAPLPSPSAAPTGQVTVVQEVHPSGGATVLLTATAVTPATALVDLQVQVVASGAPANPNGPWTSEGCGDLMKTSNGTYQCSTTVSVENPYQHSAATGWTRVQVTAGGNTVTNYGPSFAVHANIH